jgi:FkbM family methyltransferase
MYSQNNEEEIIRNYFNSSLVSYLDIGSNDGKTLSNSYAFYLAGSEGICVEASPKAFKLLQNNQPDSILINAAVGTYDGEIILYESGELLGCGDVSLVSSTYTNELDRWKPIDIKFEPISVRCITFDTLLIENNIMSFDFLTIDIEGMELDVLPQINFNKLCVKLACIEWNSKEKEKYDSIMLPQGFHIIHTNAENLIYAK